ncbi:hypothetical protein MTYM_00953 [Methylococcales bacterium]|nr:hypothetical protein MTYM_00953 [Methylococcales bacterium]
MAIDVPNPSNLPLTERSRSQPFASATSALLSTTPLSERHYLTFAMGTNFLKNHLSCLLPNPQHARILPMPTDIFKL